MRMIMGINKASLKALLLLAIPHVCGTGRHERLLLDLKTVDFLYSVATVGLLSRQGIRRIQWQSKNQGRPMNWPTNAQSLRSKEPASQKNARN